MAHVPAVSWVVAVASEVEVICVSSGWGAGQPDTFSKGKRTTVRNYSRGGADTAVLRAIRGPMRNEKLALGFATAGTLAVMALGLAGPALAAPPPTST